MPEKGMSVVGQCLSIYYFGFWLLNSLLYDDLFSFFVVYYHWDIFSDLCPTIGYWLTL